MSQTRDEPHADIITTEFATRTRSLIRLVKELRALGAEAEHPLPRIAVIGNQSAGKSSLVEAISRITVPRASGTCTRCPIECRLSYNDSSPWQCQISSERKWTTGAGPRLTNKNLLAVLNPSLSFNTILGLDTSTFEPEDTPPGSAQQLRFSDDVVCLDISGPDVVDLAFIDLPGIISNVAPGDDPADIDAVKDMVRKHVQGETLILLTITMSDDIKNQAAPLLAREEDPDGLRTIGVLTKPDRIQDGEERTWLRVLRGERGDQHVLQHGYFVTKQPSQKEVDGRIHRDVARQREIEFFRTTEPWSLEASLRGRMGTENLTKELSRLLASVIEDALPDIRKRCKDVYLEVEALLNEMPSPPSDNAMAELLIMITKFTQDLNAYVQGEDQFEGLWQQCRIAYANLRRAIYDTAPLFTPSANDEDLQHYTLKTPLDAEREAMTALLPDPGFKPRPFSSAQAYASNALHPAGLVAVEEVYERPLPSRMNLNDVREHIKFSLTRELPGNVPFKAKASLIRLAHSEWQEHCQNYFDFVHAAMLDYLRDLVRSHFQQYPALRNQIDVIIEELVGQYQVATRLRVDWMLSLDDPPFTCNDFQYVEYRQKYWSAYEPPRRYLLGNAAETYHEELIVMADVSAYFHVSYKRIIDNVPRIIDHDFLRAIARNMQKTLIERLGLASKDSWEKAKVHLAEDEKVASKRSALQERRSRLKQVLDKLQNFGV